MATMENFQELEIGDGYGQFTDAVKNATLYELDQLSDIYHDQIKEFIAWFKIQDTSTLMYKAGIEFVALLRMTTPLKNIEEEANKKAYDANPFAIEEEEHIGAESLTLQPQHESSQKSNTTIDEFKRALFDVNEVAVFNALVTSNLQSDNSKKIPTEMLFIEGEDNLSFTYTAETVSDIGCDKNAFAHAQNWKGTLQMSQCNLVHRMIARGFSLDQTV